MLKERVCVWLMLTQLMELGLGLLAFQNLCAFPVCWNNLSARSGITV